MTLSQQAEAGFKSTGMAAAGGGPSVQLSNSKSLQDASTRLQQLTLEPSSLTCRAECLIPIVASEFQPRLRDGRRVNTVTNINWEPKDNNTNVKVCQLLLIVNSQFDF